MNLDEIKQTGATLRLFLYLTVVMVLSLLLTGATAQAAPAQQQTPSAPVSAAAVGATFTVTSPNCTGPGSITEAMHSANTPPGIDTITFTSGLQINAAGCPPVSLEYFIVQATESVDFEGNGAQLVGHLV